MDNPYNKLSEGSKADSTNSNKPNGNSADASINHKEDKESPYCELNDIQVAGKENNWCYTNDAYTELSERKGPVTRYNEDSNLPTARPYSQPPPYQSSKVAADPADRYPPAQRSTRCILFVIAIVALVIVAVTVGVFLGVLFFNKGRSDPVTSTTMMTTEIHPSTPKVALTTKESLPSTTATSTQVTPLPSSSSSSTQYANGSTTPAAPFEGQWSVWSAWSDCDITCGSGTHIRNRNCLIPPCIGRTSQLEPCLLTDCPSPADRYAKWTTWGSWGQCELSCGEGEQTRYRNCIIGDAKEPCLGEPAHTRTCNDGLCPDCSSMVTDCPDEHFECLKCICPGKILSGKVLTREGTPLQFVQVSYEEFGHTTLDSTDEKGQFTLIDVCPDDLIRFSKYGYLENITAFATTNQVIRLSKIVHLHISKEPNGMSALVGGCVQLECEAAGSPGPDYYEWFHNDLLVFDVLGSQLTITDITEHQSGNYKCRASNDFTAVYSRTVAVTVEEKESEVCDTIPRSYMVQLPYGCEINGEGYVDVGACSPTKCALNYGSSCEEVPHISRCGVINFDIQEVQCTHYKLPVDVVSQCGCLSTEWTRSLRGQVFDKTSYDPIFFADVLINGKHGAYTDDEGIFHYVIPSEASRIAIDIIYTDNYYIHSTVIYVDEESTSINEAFYLKTKPAPIVFSSMEEHNIVLAANDDIESFTDIELPSNAFVDADGIQYSGEVKAYIDFLDSRDPQAFEDAPSDFTMVNEEGDVMMLESGGMFRLEFTDSTGTKPLNIGSNITIYHSLNVSNPRSADNMKLWTLDDNGRWEYLSDLQIENTTTSRRKRQIDSDTRYLTSFTAAIPGVSVTRRWTNFDAIEQYVCYSKVHIYYHDTLTRLYTKHAKVQVVTEIGNGATIATVSERSTSTGDVCIGHPCDTTRNTENTNYRGYILARNGNEFFKPISHTAMFNQFNAIVSGNKILTDFSYRNSPNGPFYDYYGGNFGYSSTCTNAAATDWSFQFYDKVEDNCITNELTRQDSFDSSSLHLPLFFYSSEHPKANQACFMRVKVTTSYKKIVLTARSYTDHTDNPPRSSNLYGIRGECVENPNYICIEYKAPGKVYNKPHPNVSSQRTRVIVHMEGKYDITEVQSSINGPHTVQIDQVKATADITLADTVGVSFDGQFCKYYIDPIDDVKRIAKKQCENVDDDNLWALHFK